MSCSSRKPVCRSPARNAGSARTAASRSRFDATPSSRVRSSASAIASTAASRSGAVDDDLRHERVVERRHVDARRDPRVDPDAVGNVERRHAAGRRAGSPAAASSATTRTSIACPSSRTSACAEPERLARRDPQLLLDEVEARDGLGHRVLDLQPGVDLEEVERAGLVEQELGGPGVDVAGRPGEADRRLAHRLRAGPASRPATATPRPASGGGAGCEHSRSPRWTQRAVRIGEQLDLHVARPLDEPLEEEPVVAERRPAPRAAPPPAPRGVPRGSRTTRIPRPPPPALALTRSG